MIIIPFYNLYNKVKNYIKMMNNNKKLLFKLMKY